MGIRRLRQDVAPYGQHTSLGRRVRGVSAGPVEKVVIDGPALVYFVYYRLLAFKNINLNLLDAQPSYEEISAGVATFLIELQREDVAIDKIYFDGALPLSKRPTRLERLEKTRAKLEECCRTHRRSYKAPKVIQSPWKFASPNNLFDASRPVPHKFTGLPEPPFMVPSVIEDLQTHWTLSEAREQRLGERRQDFHRLVMPKDDYILFGSLIEVVPGEADSYCALRAKETGATVLTSDSDLLIYDLGEGSVVMLQDIVRLLEDEVLALPEGDVGGHGEVELHATVYQSAYVRDQFTAKDVDFERIVFARKVNTHASCQQVVVCASEDIRYTDLGIDFDNFISEYDVPLLAQEDLKGLELPPLDPRVSELYLQFREPQIYGEADSAPTLFLPPIVEDSSRTCAWSYGLEFRQMAYSFLNLSMEPDRRHANISEYSRRGTRVVPTSVELFDRAGCVAAASTMLMKFRIAKRQFQRYWPDPLLCWRIFGFHEVCLQNQQQNKPVITQSFIQRFLEVGYVNDVLTWDDVHIYSEVQCVLYSVRVLKQLLRASLPKLGPYLAGPAKELSVVLKDMLPIRLLMASRTGVCETSPRKETMIEDNLQNMYALLKETSSLADSASTPQGSSSIRRRSSLRDEDPSTTERATPEHTKKRKASTSVVSKPDLETLRRRTSNPFENLESD